jgi:PAS domain S-box-containing protein
VAGYDMEENEKSRKSTRLYKELFHQIETGLAILHLENRDDPRSLRLMAANPAARRAAGVAVEDYEGKPLADRAPKLFETGIAQACVDVVRSGQAKDLGQVQLSDKRITSAIFAVKALPLPDDCAAVVFEEITGHQRADEALQECAKVAEAAQAMIAVVDRNYRYLLTNSAFLKYRGLGREQVVGRTVPEVLGKAVFERDVKKNLDACFQGEAIQYEMRYTYPDLGERKLLISYIPIKGPTGVDSAASVILDITEWRQAEEALAASEQRFRELFENATDIVFTAGLKGNVTSINKAGERSSGYTSAELTSMNVLQILAPEYVEEGRRVLEGLAAGREPGVGEWEIVAKDGHRVWLETSMRLVYRNGELVEVQGIARDITERKRAEEALRESEARFSSLFENVTVGIYRTMPGGRILMANPALVRMLGFNSFEELASRNLELEGFATGYSRRAFRERVEREGEVKGFESAWERRDGTAIFVRESARVVRASDGQPLYYDGIVEDVTERKRAEEALTESEARFRAVFENAGIGIALVDLQGHPVASNPALQKMLGYNAHELAQMAFTEFTHPDDAQADWDLFMEMLGGKRDQYQLEKRFYRKDGQIVWGQLVASLVRNQNGEPQYIVGMVEDITERKQAEEELLRSFEQLRALADRLQKVREEERTRVAREIHDELGQALTAIKIDLSSVIRELPEGRKQRSESIMKLVDQTIQSVRRISTELRPGVLDALGLVAAVEWAAEEFQTRTGMKCRLDLPQDDMVIDQERATALFRIFQETLTNVARHASATEVNVRLAKEDGDLTLEVRDNGKGIGAEQLSFGSSLGILGMRERALLLGGEFTISGAPGNGTTVRVRIPKSPPTQPEGGP